uniref:Uncharacterized protein n=1 Tax=Rhizophora mucronata TaxID=61149 RepID=A0A2P2PYE2_RHIMU
MQMIPQVRPTGHNINRKRNLNLRMHKTYKSPKPCMRSPLTSFT